MAGEARPAARSGERGHVASSRGGGVAPTRRPRRPPSAFGRVRAGWDRPTNGIGLAAISFEEIKRWRAKARHPLTRIVGWGKGVVIGEVRLWRSHKTW